MKIKVLVKTNARREETLRNPDGSYLMRVNAPPLEGKANERIVEILSDIFKKPKKSIRIVSGLRGRIKIIEIE